MARVSIRGGRKLQRFFESAAGLSDEKLAKIMATILRRTMLPAIKARVSRRTGRLQRSLRIVQRGSSIELRGVFYAQLARMGPGRDTVAEIAMDWIERNRPMVRALLAEAVRRELTG